MLQDPEAFLGTRSAPKRDGGGERWGGENTGGGGGAGGVGREEGLRRTAGSGGAGEGEQAAAETAPSPRGGGMLHRRFRCPLFASFEDPSKPGPHPPRPVIPPPKLTPAIALRYAPQS